MSEVIVITSGKGGVGKTSLTVLAASIRQNHNQRKPWLWSGSIRQKGCIGRCRYWAEKFGRCYGSGKPYCI